MQQHELNSLIAKSTEELTQLAEQTKDLQDKIEESDLEMIPTFQSTYAGTRNEIFHSTDEYCSSILTVDVGDIADYGAQISYAIGARTTVWSGP